MKLKLYGYYRSSAAYRVRIALGLKGLPYDYLAVNLAKGEQHAPEYMAQSDSGLVPTLVVAQEPPLGQSLAIIEYLEERHPEPALLPAAPLARGQVRMLAQIIACDTHPLNNLRVLNYLSQELKVDEAAKQAWYQHWTRQGLCSFERALQRLPKAQYSFSDTPTLADCCLIPQLYNAQRFSVDFSDLPRICAILDACNAHPAFQKAHPAQCPDSPDNLPAA